MARLLLFALGFGLLGAIVWRWIPHSTEDPVARVRDQNIDRNDFSILITGWSNDELTRILADFSKMYGLPADTFLIESDDAVLVVGSHSAISAAQLFYLVNYIHYPIDFDLTGRTIAAVGETRLSDATGIPPEAQAGGKAWIYMPADDRDHDVAYVLAPNGWHYRVSFRNMGWVRTEDPRFGPAVAELIASRGTNFDQPVG